MIRIRYLVSGWPRTVLAIVLSSLVTGCAPPSRQDIETAQALSELGESFNDIRQTQQALQDQVDSLSGVVARQDSVIRSLANLAGVPVPR